MTDIVAKLKSPAAIFYEYSADKGELLREAADTIEALRAENARLREQLKEFGAKKYHESWPDDRRVQIWTSVGSVRRAARAARGEGDE